MCPILVKPHVTCYIGAMTTWFCLQRILDNSDMTQEEAARLSGVALRTVARLCRNETSRVDLETLDKLARALRISPGDLIEPTPATWAKARRNGR
jgi:transcriptional regulator with XRE-family HTH domain